MAVVLKLCPRCKYHCPTRGTHLICSRCRRAARLKAQLSTLTPQARQFVAKLQQQGMSRHLAVREAFRVRA